MVGPVSAVQSDEAGTGERTAARGRRLRRAAANFVAVGLCGLVAYALARDWSEVSGTLADLSPLMLVASGLLVLLGLTASVLAWRAVLEELGSPVHAAGAAKIYLVGQLGKYVPGSVWAFVVQMELGRQAEVPRSRSFSAALMAVALNLATGVALGLLAVPILVGWDAWTYLLLLAALPLGAALIHPRTLTYAVNTLLTLCRRPPLERAMRWRGILVAVAWSVASWAAYGMSVWVLTADVGATAGSALLLCLGGVPLAMTAGFLVVVAPSGIGVREAALVAALAPVLRQDAALAVALVARLLFTLTDLLAAALTLPVRIRPVRAGDLGSRAPGTKGG